MPKVIEEELNCKVDEESARKKLVEAAQREAGAALEAEGQRLQEVDASTPFRLVMLVCSVLWLGRQSWCMSYMQWKDSFVRAGITWQ